VTRRRRARRRVALLRPSDVSLLLTGLMAAVGIFIFFMVSSASDKPVHVWTAVLWILPGLLVNALLNQGAWLRRDDVVLETVLGRATIPLDAIDAIHMNTAMTQIVVETGGVFIAQSIVTPVSFRVPKGRRARVQHALRSHRVPLRWHAEYSTMLALQPHRSASFHKGAIVATLLQPAVWLTVIAGALVLVLNSWENVGGRSRLGGSLDWPPWARGPRRRADGRRSCSCREHASTRGRRCGGSLSCS